MHSTVAWCSVLRHLFPVTGIPTSPIRLQDFDRSRILPTLSGVITLWCGLKVCTMDVRLREAFQLPEKCYHNKACPNVASEPRPSPFMRSVISRARAECNCVWANSAISGEGLSLVPRPRPQSGKGSGDY